MTTGRSTGIITPATVTIYIIDPRPMIWNTPESPPTLGKKKKQNTFLKLEILSLLITSFLAYPLSEGLWKNNAAVSEKR